MADGALLTINIAGGTQVVACMLLHALGGADGRRWAGEGQGRQRRGAEHGRAGIAGEGRRW